MLVPESMFHGKESEYHVIDWKSSKLPRVARSSLGAEAQAVGQAADPVDFIANSGITYASQRRRWSNFCRVRVSSSRP